MCACVTWRENEEGERREGVECTANYRNTRMYMYQLAQTLTISCWSARSCWSTLGAITIPPGIISCAIQFKFVKGQPRTHAGTIECTCTYLISIVRLQHYPGTCAQVLYNNLQRHTMSLLFKVNVPVVSLIFRENYMQLHVVLSSLYY